MKKIVLLAVAAAISAGVVTTVSAADLPAAGVDTHYAKTAHHRHHHHRHHHHHRAAPHR